MIMESAALVSGKRRMIMESAAAYKRGAAGG